MVTGILVLTVALADPGLLLAAEKGVFKGIDRFYGDTDGKNMFMEGSALEYFQGKTHLRFGQAQIRETATGSREIYFQGDVLLNQEELTVTGDRFTYSTEDESGTFTGAVVLQRSETRNDRGEVEKEAFKLVCGNLYLQTAEKTFVATENPEIFHEDFEGRGQTISYRDDEEKMTISGGFRLLTEQDELIGAEICFDLRQKTFDAWRGETPLEMHFDIEEKDQTKEDDPQQ
jgi:lipopolysaccharide export system protein LptA